MARLSIIIPAISDTLALEDTLVSVLTYRPADSEILLPHAATYDDPYGVGDEVVLLSCDVRSKPNDLIASAVNEAQGNIVHLLLPGCEVESGWCEAALDALADDEVASVSPVVIDETTRGKAILGVTCGFGGRRDVTCDVSARLSKSGNIFGPTLRAAFYRRGALDLIGGWPTTIGLPLADLDIALSLREVGCETVVDTDSRIVSRMGFPVQSKWTHAVDQERLFWRHKRSRLAKAARPAAALAQCLTAGLPWDVAQAAVGKLYASFAMNSARKHQERLAAIDYADTLIRPANVEPVEHVPWEPPERRAA